MLGGLQRRQRLGIREAAARGAAVAETNRGTRRDTRGLGTSASTPAGLVGRDEAAAAAWRDARRASARARRSRLVAALGGASMPLWAPAVEIPFSHVLDGSYWAGGLGGHRGLPGRRRAAIASWTCDATSACLALCSMQGSAADPSRPVACAPARRARLGQQRLRRRRGAAGRGAAGRLGGCRRGGAMPNNVGGAAARPADAGRLGQSSLSLARKLRSRLGGGGGGGGGGMEGGDGGGRWRGGWRGGWRGRGPGHSNQVGGKRGARQEGETCCALSASYRRLPATPRGRALGRAGPLVAGAAAGRPVVGCARRRPVAANTGRGTAVLVAIT